MINRPMLAASESVDKTKLKFPLMASPKFDGIRCLKLGGQAMARSLKPIPNQHIRETLNRDCPEGVDGEAMAGENFQAVTSSIMSEDGKPVFTLWAFDYFNCKLDTPYHERYKLLENICLNLKRDGVKSVKLVKHRILNDVEELDLYESAVLARGFEGVMLRDPLGPYKCGRSTLREGWLLKVKQFADAEAIIEGFEEMERNENEKTKNELGLSQRSTAKSGMRPTGMLGAFIVRDLKTKVVFRVGTLKGFTLQMRKEIWENQQKYKGRILRYTFQNHGVKDKPRIPVGHGFRDPRDM